MSVFKIIFELLVLYLLYKLVFDFIIPVYRASKQVKNQMGEMQRKMAEHQRQQQENAAAATAKESSQKPKKEDYIEFEELK